jgi:hypothetical protein
LVDRRPTSRDQIQNRRLKIMNLTNRQKVLLYDLIDARIDAWNDSGPLREDEQRELDDLKEMYAELQDFVKPKCVLCGHRVSREDLSVVVANGLAPEGYIAHGYCVTEALGLLRITFWRNALNEMIGDAQMVLEYINEAEHQNGYTYWMQFDDPEDVATDVRRYIESFEDVEIE